MPRRLPPLNAIRAFEAAGRLESFREAAEELFVTPSAVSQQVRHLEDWLGAPLFTRGARRLSLTGAGRRALPGLTEALDAMEAHIRRAGAQGCRPHLTITAMPSFAALWLVPRLPRFTDRHPGIGVRVAASERVMDLEREGIDAGVRYGRGRWPGVTAEKLMDETTTPVCSPRLLEGGPPPRRPADLLRYPLLQDSGGVIPGATVYWRSWLARFGVEGPEATSGVEFSDTHLTVMAATAGRGVMVGRSVLVADALRAGALVAPLAESLPAGAAYWFVRPLGAPPCAMADAFRDWLVEEARATEAGIAAPARPPAPA